MKRIRYLLIAAAMMFSAAATAQKNIAERQYWLDGNIAGAKTLAESPTSISIEGLKSGIHSLTVRVKDSEGLWSSQVAKYFIVPYADNSISSNSIANHQYWIDGNLQSSVTSNLKPSAVAINSLNSGLHTFTVRVQDLAGVWSSQVAKCFIVPIAETSVGDKRIDKHQYWIDGKLEAQVTQDDPIDIISIGNLNPGLHSLTVRVKDNTGVWSSQVAKYFIVPIAETSVGDKTIVKHQYWIDGKLEAQVTQDDPFNIIDIGTLNPGLHSLTVRVKDSEGLWSSQVAKYFIVPTSETSVGEKSIVLHQYWIDGNLEAITSVETQPDKIDITGLKPGLHSLTVRVKDSEGLWSSQVAKYFIVKEDDVIEDATITRYIYWFDEATDDFKTGPLESASGTIDIDISDVEAGIHTLWWRCGDSKGAWSEARSVTFESKSLYYYTVPASGIGTFSADVNLTLPDGLKAHFCTYLKEVDEGLAIKILNIDGKVINQNTGVLLSGTGGETYQLRYTSEAGSATDGNKLVPVVESTHVEPVVGEYTNYIMQGGRFIKIKQEEAGKEDIKMPAHRAYLPLLTTEVSPTPGGAKSVVLLLWDDDVVTGIESTEKVDYEPARDGHVYSISGQRLSTPRKGINIINGRKVIVK
ncbi:MAG: hypothetical protein IJ891_04570 [Prevotella sp.]|nr:hypothetical protein [Prevotella sp.]